MNFSKEFIEEIKRYGVLEIARRYTELKPSGSNYIGKCPNPSHSDSTPSFVVAQNGPYESWHCYGCHESGDGSDNIAFVQWINRKLGRNISFQEAVKMIADFYHIKIEEDKRNPVYDNNLKLAKAYQKNLTFDEAAYLIDRGLDYSDIEKWMIGFNDKRIMFPIKDKFGRISGFTGRIIDNNKYPDEPKYKNSKNSEVFNKSNILYGINNFDSSSKYILISEGVMDVILAHHYGVRYTVATLCCHLSKQHMDIIKNMNKEPVLCFDGDSAGQKGIQSALRDLSSFGIKNTKIFMLPKNKDLADISLEYRDNLRDYIESKMISYSQYMLNNVANELDAMINSEIQRAIPKVRNILNSIEDKDELIMAKSYIKNRIHLWM